MRVQQITSRHNPRFRNALQLHRSRGRKSQNRFIVFGEREVLRAFQAGAPLETVCFRDTERDLLQNDPVFERLFRQNLDGLAMPDELFQKLSYGDRQDRLIAIGRRPDLSLERLHLGPRSLVVVLQSIEKPGNIGAVLRTADGAGIDAVILADTLADPLHPNTIRSSIGTVFSIPIALADSQTVRDYLIARNFRIAVARVQASAEYDRFDWTGRTAIVLGNEATGVSNIWREPPSEGIRIPMRGIADSLNVSNSAAILIYEATRQRQ